MKKNPDKQEMNTAMYANGQIGFLRQMLTVNSAPLTLNYLFDNIRNYTLATTVVVGGVWLLTAGESIFGAPYINLIFGIHVIICGLVLIGLNFAHSILTIAKRSEKKWPAYLIYLTLLLGSLEIVWVSFWKLYNGGFIH